MIGPQKWDSLRERMDRLGIREGDLEERFVRSGGHGGQNVNKVATCVQITHRPSGVSVKCQISRFQGENRYHARRILCEKVEEDRLGKQSAREQERHRIRSQKRKRRKRTQEKLLQLKRLRSEKKRLRQSPPLDE